MGEREEREGQEKEWKKGGGREGKGETREGKEKGNIIKFIVSISYYIHCPAYNKKITRHQTRKIMSSHGEEIIKRHQS